MMTFIGLFLFVCLIVSLVWSGLYNDKPNALFGEALLIFIYFVGGCTVAGIIVYFIS
ncbi:MAG: hypothetical protein P9M03_00170 [Candidatus Theseobacter exili]|jgi:hypothetical protein|nr:hypothetical protein [Candidatus Theseobacter exili]